MANILFKKGSYKDFKKNILDANNAVTPGALYLTEDEGCLYLGTSQSSVKRIQGSVIFYEDVLSFKTGVIDNPPYSHDVIYFVVADNALIRWDPAANSGKGAWIQINATADSVVADINRLTTSITQETTRATQAEQALGSRIDATNTEVGKKLDTATYNTFKSGYDTKIAALEQADTTNATNITNAATTANNALQTATGAVADAAAALEEAKKKAPIAHAVNANTYGLGTSTLYGHVKLSDATNASSDSASGIAATPKAVKAAHDKGAEGLAKANEVAGLVTTAQTTANQAVADALAANQLAQKGVDDAENARKLAQKALDEKVNTTDFNTFKTANDEAIADAKSAGTVAQTGVTSLTQLIGSVPTGSTVMGTLSEKETSLTQLITNEKTRAEGVEQTLASNIATVSQAAAAAKAQADKGVSDADKAQKTADAATLLASQKLALGGGTMDGEIKMGSNKITGLAAPGNDLTAATNKEYVDNAIETAIAESDAMVYRGVISSSDELKAIKTADCGDTYKIGAAFSLNNIHYKIGDIIINKNADGVAPNWDHISSGFEDSYTQKLINDGTNIFLTDGVNTTNTSEGGFRIVADANSNLKFSVATEASTNIHVITATMEWGSFTSGQN